MKGHIRERAPGRWAIVLDIEDAGKRRRKWHSFRGTKRQAQIECARLISELQSGNYLEPAKTTVAQFLDRWLQHMQSQISPKSHERYTEIIQKNIVPALGTIIISKLTPLQITGAYSKALSSGRRDGHGGLAPSSVVYMHRILKHALTQAVRWQILARSPADAVDPPKLERRAMKTYDMEQTAALLEAARATRLFIPVMLAVLCGLRRGEICALRWRHVSATEIAIEESAEQTERGGIRYKEPKSGRARTVAMSTYVAEELRLWKIRQAEELLRLGIRQEGSTFVHPRADGVPLRPSSLTQHWVQLIVNARLPRIRFHDLRHAHATHLLSAGVHPKIASERLGHSKVGITLDLYSHVLPGMQADAAARVDDALRAALQKRATTAVR
jgi:integrase